MNILSLPAEIICEIGKNIELPADIVRFSLACKDLLGYNEWKNRWFARMRVIIKEINSIRYSAHVITEDVSSSIRFRKGIVTNSYLFANKSKLYIEQRLSPDSITNNQKKRFNKVVSGKKSNDRDKQVYVYLEHSNFCNVPSDKHVLCVVIYDNLIR
jgi:hypothetical protein